jgi:hypothetical protein
MSTFAFIIDASNDTFRIDKNILLIAYLKRLADQFHHDGYEPEVIKMHSEQWEHASHISTKNQSLVVGGRLYPVILDDSIKTSDIHLISVGNDYLGCIRNVKWESGD